MLQCLRLGACAGADEGLARQSVQPWGGITALTGREVAGALPSTEWGHGEQVAAHQPARGKAASPPAPSLQTCERAVCCFTRAEDTVWIWACYLNPPMEISVGKASLAHIRSQPSLFLPLILCFLRLASRPPPSLWPLGWRRFPLRFHRQFEKCSFSLKNKFFCKSLLNFLRLASFVLLKSFLLAYVSYMCGNGFHCSVFVCDDL